MGAAQGGRMQMLGLIMVIAVLLSILGVSSENNYWKFWGEEKATRTNQWGTEPTRTDPESNKGNGFAHAMPVGKPSANFENIADVEESDVSVSDADDSETVRDDIGDDSSSIKPMEGGKVGSSATNEDAKLHPPVSPVSEPLKDLLVDMANQEQSNAVEDLNIMEPDGDTNNPRSANNEKVSQANIDKNDSSAKEAEEDDTNSAKYHFQSLRRSRAKTFMVVFMGHSGSTAFTTELRTHSQFEVELLEPLEHGDYQRNTELALKKARELMDRGISKGRIPGFKIRPFHISNMPQKWRDFVTEYDTRIIWQYRENIVKQAIGEYRHRFLNDSSVVEGLGKNEKPCAKGSNQKCRIRIDNMRGLHALLNDFSGSDEQLASAARELRRDDDMSIVRYEDYLYFRERTMKEAFNFLGVDYEDTAAQRQKASPDNLCEMVSNFQELCDHFLPCQLWRPYLHDDRNNCRCKPGSWKTFDSTYCKRLAWYQSND